MYPSVSHFVRTCLVLAVGGILLPGSAASRTIKLPPETVKLKFSTLPGYAIAEQKCGICHSADYIALQPPGMNQQQWTAEMSKMQHLYGAPIDDEEIKLLGIYLTVSYGDAASVSASDRELSPAGAPPSTAANEAAPGDRAPPSQHDAQALLTTNGCLGCHALKDQVVGPPYHAVALRYRADPDAVAKVEANIRAGGVGKWGQVPMPPFPGLTAAQARTLARFVLAN